MDQSKILLTDENTVLSDLLSRYLRKDIGMHHQTPVPAAKSEDIDHIIGLELGADDYLPKPCSLRELVARVRAILRRTAEKTATTEFTAKSPDVFYSDLFCDRR